MRLARPELIEARLGHVSPGRRHNGGVVNGEGAGIAGRVQRSRAPDDEQGRSAPGSGVQDGRRESGQVALVSGRRAQCDDDGVTVCQETGHALDVGDVQQARGEAGANPMATPSGYGGHLVTAAERLVDDCGPGHAGGTKDGDSHAGSFHEEEREEGRAS